MPKDAGRQKKFLIIQARQFGDAVIGTGLVEAIGRAVPDARIDILTRPFFKDIYRNSPFVSDIYVADFPMGTAIKRFAVKEAWYLLRRVMELRRRGYSVVTLSGDFRENLLGWLVSPEDNVGVIWAEGHPFKRLVRSGLSNLLSTAIHIPANILSSYTAMQLVADAIGAPEAARPRLYNRQQDAISYSGVGNAVGLHLSASQACKMWPVENWRDLTRLLRDAGIEVKVFGAPSERARIEAELDGCIDGGVEIVTGTLQEFFENFSRMRVVVCLDSFSIHAAHAIGVPGILINGANMVAIWAPPSAVVIDGGTELACAPCMNMPTCLSTDRPYRCVRDITVERVWSALSGLAGLTMPTPVMPSTVAAGNDLR